MLNFLVNLYKQIFRNKIRILLSIFIFFLLVTTAKWLKMHTLVPSYDPSWYLEFSEIFYHKLTQEGLLSFFNSFSEAFRIKAPLISALPLPFYLIFGNAEKIAYIPGLLCIIVFNVYLFKLVKLYKSEKEAALACFIASTFPIVFSITRQFFVEYFLMTTVVIWVYYLAKSDFYRIKKYNILLGVFFGIGMLFKVLFPLFILGPAISALIIRIRQDKKWYNKKFFEDIGLIALVGLAISAIWYAKNLPFITWFLIQNSVGSVAKDYSMGSVFSFSTIKAYWQSIINYDFSFYWFAIFIITLGIVLGRFILKNNKNTNSKLFIVIILSWFLIPALLCTFGVNKASRFLMPAYPAVAIIISILIFKAVYNLRIKTTIIAAIIIFPIFNYLYLSFNIQELPNVSIIKKGFILVSKKFPGEGWQPKKEHWPIQKIVDFIHKDNIWQEQSTFIAITPSMAEFNHNNFRYYAAMKDYYLLDFGGLPRNDLQSALKRTLDGKYIITKTGGIKGPEVLNKYNKEIQFLLQEKKLPYNKIREFSMPDQSVIEIWKKEYKNYKIFTKNEKIEKLETEKKINFEEKIKFLGYNSKTKGNILEIEYYWEILENYLEEYRVFVHFMDKDDNILFGADHYIANKNVPLYKLRKGDIIKEEQKILLPEEKKKIENVVFGLFIPGKKRLEIVEGEIFKGDKSRSVLILNSNL